jgi:hypothetical protein
MDKKRLQELLEDATLDCYGEEEEFAGVLVTLDENLHFPLQGQLLGETVEVAGLSESRSSLRRGIIANVRKGERAFTASLADLTFVDPDPVSAEWLAMYRYWLGE